MYFIFQNVVEQLIKDRVIVILDDDSTKDEIINKINEVFENFYEKVPLNKRNFVVMANSLGFKTLKNVLKSEFEMYTDVELFDYYSAYNKQYFNSIKLLNVDK